MLLVLFIAIAFAGLARMYGKKLWAYALIGIGTALGAQVVTGLLYGLIVHPTEEEIKDQSMEISLLATLVSVVATIVVYVLLRRKAAREQKRQEEEAAGSEIFGNVD